MGYYMVSIYQKSPHMSYSKEASFLLYYQDLDARMTLKSSKLSDQYRR